MVSLRLSEPELADRRDRITTFIVEQAAEAGTGDAVIGLSGGIDSSLTAALAVEALGANAIRGLLMPAAVSSDRHRSDAEVVADQLGLTYDVIEIEPIVDVINTAFPDGSMGELARGNTRARIRAVLSYALANETDGLVLGTGNRSEALVGYFTKYGDGAVDCHPIGKLYKCQVRQLAESMGIPKSVIEKPPTAELWAGQTDEEELGIDYDTLDKILALHIDGPLSVSATAEVAECSQKTVENVGHLVAKSAHKRTVPPAP